MKQDGYTLCNAAVCNEPSDPRQQFEDVSHLGCLTGEYPQRQMFSPCVAKSVVINESKDIGCAFQKRAFQKRLPDVHANVLHQGSQQWVPTEQSPTLASVEAFHFLNPSYPVEQQCNSRILQDQGLPYACGVCSMDLEQYLSVQPSLEVHMDQHLQCRHDIPGFSERCATITSTCSYDQWHQIPTQLDSRMYQSDLAAFGSQILPISNCSPLHAGRSMLLPALHPVVSPQASSQITGSDDGSVTSTPPVHLPVHLDYQYLSRGIC